MELEEEVVVAAGVNVQVWEVLHIQLVSGRGRGEAACRSWAACPGRSASRKVEVEEEGRWEWEWRRGGPEIPGTLSSSRISHPPLPPLPLQHLSSPL